MKISFKALLLFGATALTAAAQDKFDAFSTMILDSYDAYVTNPEDESAVLRKAPVQYKGHHEGRRSNASVFVTLEPGATAADVEALGFETMCDLGNIVICRGSMEDIRSLADYDFVKAISFGRENKAHMAVTRSVTGADVVQSGGQGLPKGYTGKGVIAGLFDTGIDPNHVNFLDANGVSRVKRMWVFNGNDGSYTEYKDMEVAKVETDNRAETHGTHTMGCMAGSWDQAGGGAVAVVGANGRIDASRYIANPYYGMAPGTELVAAAGTLYDDNTITAVNNIVEYALSQNKPVVVNLSLGSNSGPHDGTDAVCQALTNVIKKGAIVCVSAGNEGEYNISLEKSFTAEDNTVATFIDGTYGTEGSYEFWSSNSKTFDFEVFIYDLKTGEYVYTFDFNPTDSRPSVRLGQGGIPNTVFSQAFSQSYIQISKSANTGTNNRYSVVCYASLSPNSTYNSGGQNYAFGFRIKGQPDQIVQITTSSGVDFTSYGVEGFSNGSPDFSINNMACAPEVVAVGSWNASVTWPTLAGMMDYSSYGYKNNTVSPFSSYGKLLDGRELPDICAPGLQVVSSISTYYYNNYMMGTSSEGTISAEQEKYSRKNYYYAESGTSMASPVCAGAVATWLEANPHLTAQQVKTILKETANSTNLATAFPSYRWGAGKLDALAGIKYVIEKTTGINDVTADGFDKVLFAATGDNAWEVYVPNADYVTADVYSIAGTKVASVTAEGNTLNLSCDGLANGIYVVNVNGRHAERIIVR